MIIFYQQDSRSETAQECFRFFLNVANGPYFSRSFENDRTSKKCSSECKKGSNVNKIKWLNTSKNSLNETRLHKWNQDNTKCETTLLLSSLSLFQLHWLFLKCYLKAIILMHLSEMYHSVMLVSKKTRLCPYETTYNMAHIKITVRIS